MNTKSIFSKGMLMLLSATFLLSCVDKGNFFTGTKQEQKDALSGPEVFAKYCNFKDLQVSISSNYTDGRYYAIYVEYPYDSEKDLIGSPLLTGCTPINETISVPSGADTLYVLNDEGVTKYASSAFQSGKLTISDSRSSLSRVESQIMNEEELNIAIRKVNNEFLPEKCFNVRNEELYKCTDLHIMNLTENQTASVWITPIKADMPESMLWYYTYSKIDPTTDDCTFYGIVNNEIQKVDYTDILNKKNPLVNAKNVNLKNEVKLPSETFRNDTYVGFVYNGSMGPHFTTPSLNTKASGAYTDENSNNSDCIGWTVKYESGKSFKIEKNINSGIIHHFECFGSQYNVVGMENRLPNQHNSNNAYDGDYNDMVLLIRTNPETISPKDQAILSKPELTLWRQGTWIFEDNYPEEGDFDFNDVVVAYSIEKSNAVMNITCKLVAKGCSNHNDFGVMILPNKNNNAWQNPVYSDVYFEDINGYFNVYEDKALDFSDNKCPSKTFSYATTDFNLIRPFIKDNKNGIRFSLDNYNTPQYPYGIDIPSYGVNEKNTWFRWPLEGHSIDEAYWFTKNKDGGARINIWYYNSQTIPGGPLVNRGQYQSVW